MTEGDVTLGQGLFGQALREARADGYQCWGCRVPARLALPGMPSPDWEQLDSPGAGVQVWLSPHRPLWGTSWRRYGRLQLLCGPLEAPLPRAPARTAPLTLRPYQIRAVRRLERLWKAGLSRLMLQSVTGSGKTEMYIAVILSWLAAGGTVVVMVPRRELVLQTVQRLLERGLPERDVGQCMDWTREGLDRRVVVCTYQGVFRLSPRARRLVVIDEAHHTGAPTVLKALQSLHPERVLGVSATPRREDGTPLGDVFEQLVVALEYAEAFRQGYLVPPRYYTAARGDLEALEALRQRLRQARARSRGGDISVREAEAWMLDPQVVGDILQHIRERAHDRQGILYTATVGQAGAMTQALRRAGYAAQTLSAGVSPLRRREVLEQFRRGEVQWLVNVDLLTEGVDVPACSAVVIARPTRSVTRWIQMVGRALRPAPGKRECVVLDHTGSLLELHPVEVYTARDWVLHRGSVTQPGGHTQAAADVMKEGMSLEPRPRSCPCGHGWTGGPVCPNCGAITVGSRYLEEEIVAMQATLQEYRVGEAGRSLLRTHQGHALQPADLVGVLRHPKLTVDQRAVVLQKLTTPGQREELFRALIDWAQTNVRSGQQPALTRARAIYRHFFGGWPSGGMDTTPSPVSDALDPVLREILRINRAAHAASRGKARSAVRGLPQAAD